MSKKKTNEEFEKEVFNLVGSEYLVIGKYENTKTKMLFQHNLQDGRNHTFEMTPAQFLKGNRCRVCNNHVIVRGYNDISSTNEYLQNILLNPEDGCVNNENTCKKLYFKCPSCGNIILQSPYSIKKYGLSCKKCGDGISRPNKYMFNILSQLRIDFTPEYSPEWINPKRYDFYFKYENEEYIVEMDGGIGHGKSCNYWGIDGYETKKIDNMKDKIALEHGISVIRIRCDRSESEYIENAIKTSELIKILDLEQINWGECNEYSLKSIMYDACKLWNEKYLIHDIAEKLKIHVSTVIRYLKEAQKIGLIKDYNESNSKRRATSKKIICLNNGQVFESIKDAAIWCGSIDSKNIRNVLSNNQYFAHYLNGEKLKWMYYKDYLNVKEDIFVYYDKVHKKNKPVKVMCTNTKEIFDNVLCAGKWCGLKFPYSILDSAKGDLSSAGKHPITKEKLYWEIIE